MKYILYNDFKYTFSKKNKMLLVYFIMVLLYSLYSKTDILDNEILNMILGVNFSFENVHPINFIFFIFCIGYPIYLSFNLFISDNKTGYCNLFLRMKSNRWITLKLISIFIYLLIIKIIIYLIPILIGGDSLLIDIFIVKIFFTDLIFSYLNSIILIFLYLIGKKNLSISGIIFIISLIIMAFFKFNIIYISNYLHFLIFIFIICNLLLIFLFKYLFVLYFE